MEHKFSAMEGGAEAARRSYRIGMERVPRRYRDCTEQLWIAPQNIKQISNDINVHLLLFIYIH